MQQIKIIAYNNKHCWFTYLKLGILIHPAVKCTTFCEEWDILKRKKNFISEICNNYNKALEQDFMAYHIVLVLSKFRRNSRHDPFGRQDHNLLSADLIEQTIQSD